MSGSVYAGKPFSKYYTTVYDKKLDTQAFLFNPNPSNSELHLVSSNLLVWAKYTFFGAGRNQKCDTTIYVQGRKDLEVKHIVKFGGKKMPEVVGVSPRGSILFEGGEEFIFGGDESERARETKKDIDFFLPDARNECSFIIESVTSPSAFANRFKEDKTPLFTILILKKSEPKVMKEVVVTAASNDEDPMWQQIKKGELPSTSWLGKQWPVVDWHENGFTYWDGYAWKKFKWDANRMIEETR